MKSYLVSVNRVAYGHIDGTLIITTGLKIYQTKDQGKSWTEAMQRI